MRRQVFSLHQVTKLLWFVLYGAVYLWMTTYFSEAILNSGEKLGIYDWDAHTLFNLAAYKNIYEYGILPFWNPWYCGGNVLWQNPLVPLLNPAYAIAPYTGFIMAMKITVAIHFFFALVGVHLLVARYFKVRSFASRVFLTSVFTFSGTYTLHIATGHTNFIPALYAPFILFFYLKALDSQRLRHIFWAAIPAALIILNGAIHVFAMLMLGVSAFTLVYSLLSRKPVKLVLLAVFALSTFMYAAPKILPTVLFTHDPHMIDQRNLAATNAGSVPDSMLMHIFTDPQMNWDEPRPEPMPEAWWEYGNFIGTGAMSLFLGSVAFALIFALRQRFVRSAQPLALLATCFLLFYLYKGDFGPWAPYNFVRNLPVFDFLRVPSRYMMTLTLFATSLAAWALARLDRLMAKSWAPRLFWGTVLIFAGLSPFLVNRQQFARVFHYNVTTTPLKHLSKPLPPDQEYQPQANSPMLTAMLNNRFVLDCYEPMQVKRSYRQGLPVVYSEPREAMTKLNYKPSRIKAELSSTVPARVFLNQNICKGWTTNFGPLKQDMTTGSYFVSVPPGETVEVKFFYQPEGIYEGFILLILGIVGSILASRRFVIIPSSFRAPRNRPRMIEGRFASQNAAPKLED